MGEHPVYSITLVIFIHITINFPHHRTTKKFSPTSKNPLQIKPFPPLLPFLHTLKNSTKKYPVFLILLDIFELMLNLFSLLLYYYICFSCIFSYPRETKAFRTFTQKHYTIIELTNFCYLTNFTPC